MTVMSFGPVVGVNAANADVDVTRQSTRATQEYSPNRFILPLMTESTSSFTTGYRKIKGAWGIMNAAPAISFGRKFLDVHIP